MSKLFNVYCDESCHLESPTITTESRFMALGCVICPSDKKDTIFKQIKKIKKDNGLNSLSEIKWTKISKTKLNAYKNIINYFFDCENIYFRSVIIDKKQLKHTDFFQTHDEFYYKMYFLMLKWLPEQFANKNDDCKFYIYLDIKDTLGRKKIQTLKEILSKSYKNVDWFKKIQEVRSHEIVLMQITDLLIGAVTYANRYPEGGKSDSKNAIVSLIKERLGKSLIHSTYPDEVKFNLFKWDGKK